jgi:hypothetical protein
MQFYIQMRNLSLLVTTIYSVYIILELANSRGGPCFNFGIFLLVIACVIFLGITYAQITKQMHLNYWFLALLIMRIAVGIIEDYFTGFSYRNDTVSNLINTFYSYHIMEGFLYLIINVSH